MLLQRSNCFVDIGICLALLVISLLLYYPGLSGGFLLDDFGNLDKLGDFNGVRNLDTFLKYMSSGIAGPTGRPLSLLSFLLNGTNWPTDPFPFKLTNVLLHGLSGIFLYHLCQQILICFNQPSNRLKLVAGLITTIWLTHPFLVSTVLYVVQRMAMLSAFFSIAGLFLYCKGRHLTTINPRRAYILMSVAVTLGTLLAILSKENGALLPLLIYCVELCIFKHPKANLSPLNKLWENLFLIFPSLLIFGYLAYQFDPFTLDHPFQNRSFTLPERLMTESRLVTEYLYHLYIPQMFYPGLMNENITISKNLLTPVSTLFSILFLLSIFILALIARLRWPLLSLGILFFLSGHLVESTSIGLELYFEHRNYLSSIFLFLPVGSLLLSKEQKLIYIGIILLLITCAVFTYQRSKLWGNPLELALFWSQQNPTSSRAQRTAALELENANQLLAAFNLLNNSRKNIPDSLDLQWHWFILKCQSHGVTKSDINTINQITEQSTYTSRTFNMLQATVETMLTPECKGVTDKDALNMLNNLLNNLSVKNNVNLHFQIHHLKGIVYAKTQQPQLALEEFNNVLNLTQNVEHGLVEVGILASHHYFEQALEHLNRLSPLAEQAEKKLLDQPLKPEYSKEIIRIRQNILEELTKN